MSHQRLLYLLLFALASTTFTACDRTTQSELLDADLEAALNDASDGIGSIYYRLPDSDDFNNIPQDPNNPINAAKVELGKLLFHETALGIKPKETGGYMTYSCASCHHAQGGFQACLPQGIGEGGIGFGATGEGRTMDGNYAENDLDVQAIRSPSALHSAFQTNLLWNGQFGATHLNVGTEANWTAGSPKEVNHLGFQGAETQAIAGFDVHRMGIDTTFLHGNSVYRELFAEAFPNTSIAERYTKVNIGLAMAAYERTLLANEAPFQQWLRGESEAMTEAQKRGAILFFGKAECGSCHNGPALNTMEFHALGMNDLDGVRVHNYDPLSVEHLGRGGFTGKVEDKYKFKVPQLYNLKSSPFYGHGASFTDVRDVVEYKNNATPENQNVDAQYISPLFQPLNLTNDEIDDIVVFLNDALYDNNLERYVPSSLPSGNCFPNNDPLSSQDLGCN